MAHVDIPSTVNEILLWKNSNIIEGKTWPVSVESLHGEYVNQCEGSNTTDVLYSFLSIYAIGIWVFNKDGLFKIEKNKIKTYSSEKRGKYDQILCSKAFLLRIQDGTVNGIEVSELNNVLKDFVNVYFSVGNLIPMWPGGNVYKGNQNNGFMDIPELFFNKYMKSFWLSKLLEYKYAFLDEVVKQAKSKDFNSLNSFLISVDSIENYTQYINRMTNIINNRTNNIKQILT